MPEPIILEVVKGKDAGRWITVPANGAVVGRGADCEVTLDEPSVSRRHCRIVWEKDEWVIEDLGSRCGVIINGQVSTKSRLKQGDEITLAALVLKVVKLPFRQVVPAQDTISFPCKCGKVHVVKIAFAGKTFVCKQCGAKRVIPAASLPRAAPLPASPLPNVEPSSGTSPVVSIFGPRHLRSTDGRPRRMPVTEKGLHFRNSQLHGERELKQEQRPIRHEAEPTPQRGEQREFPNYNAQERPAPAARTPQLLGIIGSIALFIGVFLPVVSGSRGGSLSYFQNGRSDGTILLILAVISFFLVRIKGYQWLLLTGLGSFGDILFALINVWRGMSQAKTKVADNPLRGAIEAVHLQWGWAVLVVGACLVIAAAVLELKDEWYDLDPPGPQQ
jgi:hypothetical protein